MAEHAIHRGWEVNPQVVNYYCHFRIRGGAISVAAGEEQEGEHITAAYTAAGDYLLTIDTPAGIGSALDIINVQVTKLTALVDNQDDSVAVAAIDQANRTVQLLNTGDVEGAPPALADPVDGDGFFVCVTTRHSLAGQ